MRFIPTRVHGVIDDLTGVLLIVSPWLFGFANGGAAQWIPVVIGAGAIVYSLLTRYELGVAALIPMPGHLALDAMAGVVLVISPWLFGFAGLVWLPHVIIGAFEIVASGITRTEPGGNAARGALRA